MNTGCHGMPNTRLFVSLSSACVVLALAFTQQAPLLAVAKVVRPAEPRVWAPTSETTAARPAANYRLEATERPERMATKRPLWEPQFPEEMVAPLPLPLPPMRRRTTTRRPPIVAMNGTSSEEEYAAGSVDGAWPQSGSTSQATIPPTTTVEAVPLHVIDAPERTQAADSSNCAPGQRWHNNRCRTVAGGR
ncbi:uncharacterized protein LOC124162466 [Ischnura elegans]|uniref:uncharacterized protein LOC124162466 n=1 Tax=Ischnura elegans TaxID=197161 RepID=UPI001ED88746|nr:uncharacterized protein LOC124162466 [Ischnura elegans]